MMDRLMDNRVQVKLKKNENIDRAIKRLKREVNSAGIIRDLNDRKYFVKPGDKKRKKSAQARARNRKEEMLSK